MPNDLKEARAILEIVANEESPRDALMRLKIAGYEEDDAEMILDSAMEILELANSYPQS